MPTQRVNQQVTITGADEFTEWAAIRGIADVSASGITDSTVTVQRSFDEGETIKDVESFVGDFEKVIEAGEQGIWYRVGVKTDEYGSDTIIAGITQ